MNSHKKQEISEPFTLPVETSCGSFNFECRVFYQDKEEYIALKKDWEGIPLIRIESLCNFGITLGSELCNCGPQFEEAKFRIGTKGGLLLLAMHQDGRCIRLVEHANAYALQKKGYDTVSSYEKLGLKVDSRSYSYAAKIIKFYYGVEKAKLMTNNLHKVKALEENRIKIIRVPAIIPDEKLNIWRARQFLAAHKKMGQPLPKKFVKKLIALTS